MHKNSKYFLNFAALLAAIFCAASARAETSPHIVINEILPNPAGEDKESEFVEITNTGEECADVSGWKVMDEAGHKKEFSENSIIEPGEYLILEGNLYLNNDSDTVYLLDANGNAKTDAQDKIFYEKAAENFSFSFDGKNWQWTTTLTPGDENMMATNKEGDESGEEENKSGEIMPFPEGLFLNEILPSPKNGSDGEYIEIKNGTKKAVDLYKWAVRDGSKTGKYVFEKHQLVKPGKYFAIFRSKSKLALNNSDESVRLFDPQGKIASSVSWEKSPKNASYNFDGRNWRWSKYLTPGKGNEFDSAPEIKIEKPKNAYANLPTEFSAKAGDKETKKLKFVWDFGDEKKSYQKKTTHKYLDTGEYVVTLSVTDESQTIEKSFVVNVKDFPRPDLEVVKVVPNPAGADADGETIDIKNNSKKKVDLFGWKITTGSGENMYNHPITDELAIDSGKTSTITRANSKFSLNNQAGRVALVMPNGETIDEVEYSKEKIAESEAYVKIAGDWQWLAPDIVEEGGVSHGESGADTKTTQDENEEAGEILGATDENPPADYTSIRNIFSPEDFAAFLSRIGFGLPRTEPNYCPLNDSPFSLAYLLASSI